MSAAIVIASRQSAVFEASEPDPVVEVLNGPATIFIIQDGRVLATLEWPRDKGGTVTVPLQAVVSSASQVFVGVMPGLIPPPVSDQLRALMCPHCYSRVARVPCCP
jgi:hypothetical protein